METRGKGQLYLGHQGSPHYFIMLVTVCLFFLCLPY